MTAQVADGTWRDRFGVTREEQVNVVCRNQLGQESEKAGRETVTFFLAWNDWSND